MNTCICCGIEIPEGRQVCWNCEHSYDGPDAILEDGTHLYLKTKNIPGGENLQFELYEHLLGFKRAVSKED